MADSLTPSAKESLEASSCSALTVAAGEPLAGTATLASAWIVIEQSGPYGRDALTESRFPADIGAELLARADEIGAKVVLIRNVGKHSETPHDHAERNVWVARPAAGAADTGTASMVHTTVGDPAELLAINFGNLLTGNLADSVPHSSPDHEPLLLVCTHAKRDMCCAIKGRPVAIDLCERAVGPGRVWEVSHLGGHRMAPTAVQLPDGYLHGRLDTQSADQVCADAIAGRLTVETCRGRSSLTSAAQVAELAVRSEFQLVDLDGLQVVHDRSSADRIRDGGLGTETWIVASQSTGDSWEVDIETQQILDRPESCGKAPVPAQALRALAIRRRD